MKKWTCVVLAMVGLALTMAMSVGALSLAQPNIFNDKYVVYHCDYNQDGIPELVTFGGESGEYSWENYPDFKLYILTDGKARMFEPAEDIRYGPTQKRLGSTYGYQNKHTGEHKWVFFTDEGPDGRDGLVEVTFDFENFTFQTALDTDYDRWTWQDDWEGVGPLNYITEGEGKLTEDIIMQFLLEIESSATQPITTTKPSEATVNIILPRIPASTSVHWAVIPAGIALLGALIAVMLFIRKRRT